MCLFYSAQSVWHTVLQLYSEWKRMCFAQPGCKACWNAAEGRCLQPQPVQLCPQQLPSGNCCYPLLSPKWCQVVILESTGWYRQNHGRGSADNKTVQAVARQCVILHLGPELFGTNNSGNVTASISIYEAHELSEIFCSQFFKIKGPCLLQALSVRLDKGRRQQFPRSCKQPQLFFTWLTKVQIKKTWPSLLRAR